MNGIYVPIRVSAENVSNDQWKDILEKVNRHTLEDLNKEDIFIFSGICSNDRMDAYMTKMDPLTTLKNYVDDLQRGVPLQDGHDIFKSPYGRSYDGSFISSLENDGEYNAVRSDWYMIRDITANGIPTNDEIRAIKGGIKKDLSVGFGGNQLWYRCSSCNRDVFDWECPHIPGLEDENGRMSFSWVVDGHLREVSTVYQGATPGAYIDKARAYVQQGQLSTENILKLEREYQVRLDDGKRSFFMPKKEGKQMDLLAQIRTAIAENKIEKGQIYDILMKEGEKFRQPEDIGIRNELGDKATVEGIKSLKAEAEMGRAYVTDLIDQAVKSRVKVQGTTFNSDKYKEMLIRVNDVDFIKDEIESYEKQALEKFVPGRQTKQDDIAAPEQTETRSTSNTQDENIFD